MYSHKTTLPVVHAIPIINPRKRSAIMNEFLTETEDLPLQKRKKAKDALQQIFNQLDREFYDQRNDFIAKTEELNEKMNAFQTTADICMETEKQLTHENEKLTEEITTLNKIIQETPSLKCSVCMEDLHSLIRDGIEMISCESNHIFCAECLNAKTEGSIINAPANGVLRCDHDKCKHNLCDHFNFNTIVSKSTRRKFENACMEARVRKEVEENNTQVAHGIVPGAFVCKRPCCGKPMPINFNGCMSFDCPDCNACFCGLCMKVFKPKGNNLAENNVLFRCHEHVSTCKHNVQAKNEDGVASYYINEQAQTNVTRALWQKYFLTQRMLIDHNPATVRKLLGLKPSIQKMTAFCASLGLPIGPYGFVGTLGEDRHIVPADEVIIID